VLDGEELKFDLSSSTGGKREELCAAVAVRHKVWKKEERASMSASSLDGGKRGLRA